MEDVLVTLEGEKMFVETIFREIINGEEFLYWYSIQGKGGIDVEDSEHWWIRSILNIGMNVLIQNILLQI